MTESTSAVSNVAGGTSDLFGAAGDIFKAQGAQFDKSADLAAADLAEKNAQFAAVSTNLKQYQLSRQIYQSQSQTEANVAGAGLKNSGSALDILSDSASQGVLTKAVAENQGIIQEEGYEEQAKSYQLMASAAGTASIGADIAGIGSTITGAIKGAAGLSSLLGGTGAAAGGASEAEALAAGIIAL